MIKLDKNISFEEIKNAVILHNTGYMFGIGCFYNSEKAINRISQIKKRTKKGFIILLSSITELTKYSNNLTKSQLELINMFSPGNVTFIIDSNNQVPDFLKIEGYTAFRIPQSKSLRNFIESYKLPLISTSINKSGEPPLKDFKQIDFSFGEDIDFYLSIPESEILKESPSTIVKFRDNELELIREGIISFSIIKREFEKLQQNSK